MERGAKSYIWVTAAVTMIFVAPLLARSERVAVTDRPYDTEAFAALIAQNSAGDTVGKARVDYRSDVTILSNQGAFAKLVGNVAFHHNGVIITCDTAYRYSDKNMEGLGSVIINANDSTYIYGDRFTYDGESNIARVYSPIIKLVDGNAVLYTHNLSFNTLTGVGSYYGGRTMTQGDNLMESERGDYYTSSRDIVLVGGVEMHNDDYDIKSDSVAFNLNTEVVTFYKPSDIWSRKGDYLHTRRGTYDRATGIYDFVDSAYVMTEDQELWSDSLRYMSLVKEVELRGDIQILDTSRSLYTFGDYGYYWSGSKRVIMTGNPSSASFDDSEEGDTTFMRADTMIVVPQLVPGQAGDSIAVDSISGVPAADEPAGDAAADTLSADSAMAAVPEIVTDSIAAEASDSASLNPKKAAKRLKKLEKKARRRAKRAERAEKRMRMIEEARAERRDSLAAMDTLHADTVVLDTLARRKNDAVHEADSSDYILRGYHNVRIYKRDVQAVCDSIAAVTVDSTMFMYSSPIIWNENNQITASYIKIYTVNEQLDRAELYDYPIIGQRLRSDRNRYNQIRGKYMECYFKDNELDIVYIDGNAETIFYKEQDGRPNTMMYIMSADMEITFDSSEISRLKWIKDITHSIYPIDKIAANQKLVLEGFRWITKPRPKTRFDVCDRVIRPSERETTSSLVRPRFLITAGINQERVDLAKAGVWHDRTESSPVGVGDFLGGDLVGESNNIKRRLSSAADSVAVKRPAVDSVAVVSE